MQGDAVVLLTGGTGDIGTAIVKQLKPLYGHIIALDIISKRQAAAWLDKFKLSHDEHVSYHYMDVTNFKDCRSVITSIIAELGRVDILINNAGITRDAFFTKMTKLQWDEVMAVNLDSMFNVTHQVVDQMKKQEYGRIVNISSVNAHKGQFSQTNYAAAKAGIYGFTKSLAQELMAKNITVNSISPGYINTHLMQDIRADILQSIIERIPAKRLGEPEEVAWVVEFLVNKKSKYITGADLSIDGGLYMH